MFKSFAAVLIAASMLTAPAFAQGTSSAPATQMTKAPVVKAPVVKVVKAKKHAVKKHYAHVRKHVKHVHYARHGRHHVVKHVSAKPTHAVQTVGSAPKAGTN